MSPSYVVYEGRGAKRTAHDQTSLSAIEQIQQTYAESYLEQLTRLTCPVSREQGPKLP